MSPQGAIPVGTAKDVLHCCSPGTCHGDRDRLYPSWEASQGGDPSSEGAGKHVLCWNTLLPTSHGRAPAPGGTL